MSYTISREQARATAHRIADFIYEKLTGDKGVFSTRIAYVEKRGAQYRLMVADADGENAQAMLTSNEPIMSPAWSPDGSRLAYVSFQQKKPIIYVQRLSDTRQPTPVVNFRGSNSAPAWSPDGRQPRRGAVAGRRHAALPRRRGRLGCATAHELGRDRHRAGLLARRAIDLLHVRPRRQPADLPRVGRRRATSQRITFSGDYNVSPRVSPDGKTLAYVSRSGGRFQVAAMDLGTRQTQVLTDGARDESPSFAPNGKMILYATDAGGRGVLAATSSDGRVKQRLSMPAADVREPAWGPYSPN